MLSLCVLSLCVKLLCKEAGGAGGGEGARDTESKTRTPHKVVGKQLLQHTFVFTRFTCNVAVIYP